MPVGIERAEPTMSTDAVWDDQPAISASERPPNRQIHLRAKSNLKILQPVAKRLTTKAKIGTVEIEATYWQNGPKIGRTDAPRSQ